MANQWFKFYGGEYLSDPKILQLTAQERSCWVTLLCLANQSEDGVVKFLSEKQLLALSGITQEIPNILTKFEKLEMIRISNGIVTVKNWEKRQMSEGYSRVKQFRKRQSNANDNDRREEKRKKEEIELPIWLNKKAWDAWVTYKKERKQALKPSTIKMQLKLLEKNMQDHTEIIRNSITNGWTGLFQIKNKQPNARVVSSQKRASENEDQQEREITEQENERRKILLKQSKNLAEKMTISS